MRNGDETKTRNDKNTTTAETVTQIFLEEVIATTGNQPDALFELECRGDVCYHQSKQSWEHIMQVALGKIIPGDREV